MNLRQTGYNERCLRNSVGFGYLWALCYLQCVFLEKLLNIVSINIVEKFADVVAVTRYLTGKNADAAVKKSVVGAAQ